MILYLDGGALRCWRAGCAALATLAEVAQCHVGSGIVAVEEATAGEGRRLPLVLVHPTPHIVAEAVRLRRQWTALDPLAAVHVATACLVRGPELVAAFADPMACRVARHNGLVTAALSGAGQEKASVAVVAVAMVDR